MITMKTLIRTITVASLFVLGGCATNPDIEKSMSRDKTMEKMAKTALINEMLISPDPHIRAKGASIAEQFLIEPRRNIFGF